MSFLVLLDFVSIATVVAQASVVLAGVRKLRFLGNHSMDPDPSPREIVPLSERGDLCHNTNPAQAGSKHYYNIPPWKQVKRTKELGVYYFLAKTLSKY